MNIRASDKIPGARVKARKQPPAVSSGARPREWLALADGLFRRPGAMDRIWSWSDPCFYASDHRALADW